MSDPVGTGLLRFLSDRAVQRLAGYPSYRRGTGYVAERRVGGMRGTPTQVVADVAGKASYTVRFWVQRNAFEYDCTCPIGGRGEFCKHAVAVALTLTSQPDAIEVDGVDPTALPLADLKRRVTSAFRVGSSGVDYYRMPAYAARIHSTIDLLEDVLAVGRCAEAQAAIEHAIKKAESVIYKVDDSDGWFGEIDGRLADLYLAAMQTEPLPPVELARKLFMLETEGGDLPVLAGSWRVFGELLGDEGTAEFRRLAQQAWDALPPVTTGFGEASRNRRDWSRLMEELAKDFGDIDDEIAILSADLTMSWQWVRVIRRVQEADRHNDALDWVERALVKFVSAPGLAELAIEEYYRAGLTDKIVPLVWDEYTAQPTGQGYRRLADHAARVGVWEDWHDRALAALRRWVDHCRSVPSGDPSFLRTPEGQRYLPHASGAHLVSAYLYDGDVESAWVEAQADDVSDEVRLDVALQRQAERRADAIPILQRIVRRDASLGGNDAYARAIEGMRRVRDLMVETGVSDDFAPYLASVRETFQRKRNLMALIDREGW